MTVSLTMDVWEHAYHVDYQNRRADYVNAVLGNLSPDQQMRHSDLPVLAWFVTPQVNNTGEKHVQHWLSRARRGVVH